MCIRDREPEGVAVVTVSAFQHTFGFAVHNKVREVVHRLLGRPSHQASLTIPLSTQNGKPSAPHACNASNRWREPPSHPSHSTNSRSSYSSKSPSGAYSSTHRRTQRSRPIAVMSDISNLRASRMSLGCPRKLLSSFIGIVTSSSLPSLPSPSTPTARRVLPSCRRALVPTATPLRESAHRRWYVNTPPDQPPPVLAAMPFHLPWCSPYSFPLY